ncbi:MAG: smalltalk protein [Bacteroidaceae bacterium]|nr:smalltalk protein [Bacteroidaceae bacterium]MBR1755001.1 smalltalk protein [Bacteroidaceae bacterium]
MTPTTKRTLRRIGDIIITIITALLTAIGTQSCVR